MAGCRAVVARVALGDGAEPAAWHTGRRGAGALVVSGQGALERADPSAVDPAAGGDGVSAAADLRADGAGRGRSA